ncbi:MAG TPA: phosphatidate cytidylyltransferase, partial [Planctomycetota bacterium]|nr:phosphatidate cytidylyltransferase [Planctomycetota bacterium]
GLPFRNSRWLPMCLAIVCATGIWPLLWDPVWGVDWPGWQGLPRYAATWLAMLLGAPLVYGIAQAVRASSPTIEEGKSIAGFQRAQAWVWLVVPLACLYPTRLLGGLPALMALVVLSKVGDIAGYYVGSLLGRSHPFPRLSPGKTTAGCVGSLLSGIGFGIGCQAWGWFPPGSELAAPGYWAGAVAGASINLAAQAGDLYESFWKRKAGVKDSGTWFGPSGGMLDLVDSLLFSAPLAALTWPFLFRWF